MLAEASADGDGDISFGEFLLMMHRARRQGRAGDFSKIVDVIEAKHSVTAGAGIIYLFLFLTFLVLISTSTTLLNFFKCQDFAIPEADGGGTSSFLQVKEKTHTQEEG